MLFLSVGSPADGILFPGDHVLQINDNVLEDLSAEQVENILRWGKTPNKSIYSMLFI